jgi:hypothetical protein
MAVTVPSGDSSGGRWDVELASTKYRVSRRRETRAGFRQKVGATEHEPQAETLLVSFSIDNLSHAGRYCQRRM